MVTPYSFPVHDLIRTLDAMSWVKLNTFHWHITDSESFPLEVSQFPALAENGAYSLQEVYTESDVQYIVSYAAAVRVYNIYHVLKFNLPQAWN